MPFYVVPFCIKFDYSKWKFPMIPSIRLSVGRSVDWSAIIPKRARGFKSMFLWDRLLYIVSYCFTLYDIVWLYIVSYCMILNDIVWLYIASYCMLLYDYILFHIVSHCMILYDIWLFILVLIVLVGALLFICSVWLSHTATLSLSHTHRQHTRSYTYTQ